MKNLYKRLDIFRCILESHQGFGNLVSVYHVLKEKKCYPQGCVYFQWKCQKFEHKLNCPKSYSHVGRNCTACMDYYDEKIIKRPKLLLSQEEYLNFLKGLRDFETWLDRKKGKEANCSGVIKSLKPQYLLNRRYDKNSLSFKGFILTFDKGFIDLTPFDGLFFAHISSAQQSRLKLSQGDRLEFKATLYVDRGRIILKKLRHLEIEEKGQDKPWTIIAARQALFSGTLLDHQYPKCLLCPHGALVDLVESQVSKQSPKRRSLFCLKGITHPEYCITQAQQEIYQQEPYQIDGCEEL